MEQDGIEVGSVVKAKEGIFMPYITYCAKVVKIGMPTAYQDEVPRFDGGDWIIIDSHGGWLPRSKFELLDKTAPATE